jgi:hypothetical protein
MREDMPRRFLEPSSGKRGKFPRNSKKYRPDEDGLTPVPIEGMKKLHSVVDPDNEKYTGTDLRLMRRFLMSRRGHPWDEVYSEICQQADYRSHSGHHLREWIGYLVDQNCQIIDGVLADERGIKTGAWWDQFYVHPETKTLEFIEHHRYRRKEHEKTVFEMDDVLYHKHDGIWYRVKFKPIPKQTGRSDFFSTIGIRDVFMEKDPPENLAQWSYWSLTRALIDKYGPGQGFCCWKQQANSHEIDKLKKLYPEC